MAGKTLEALPLEQSINASDGERPLARIRSLQCHQVEAADDLQRSHLP